MTTVLKLARQRRGRNATIYKWLRDRTSPIDYGKKYKGHPIHCNKNADVLNAFRTGHWLSRMTNDDFDAHFEDRETFYFTANGSPRCPEILVMIDIDCHGRGTLAGALEFARHLRDHHYPNLYFETSTNGNGVHAYVIVEKADLGDECVNDLLKRLDKHLKGILAHQDFDVELVEVKGTCPIFVWGTEKGQLTNYRSGQLAKLPRERDRFDELKKTTKIKAIDLFRLAPVQNDRSPRLKLHHQPQQHACGSITGKVISDAELSQLSGHYGKVAALLLDNHPLRTTGRALATVEDVAIFLMSLRFFTQNMNIDGSLPQARFKGLWEALFLTGDVGRPFDDKRFAVIRNYLSSLGLLDWEDETFVVGDVLRRGRACKWKANDLLMGMLDWERVGTSEVSAAEVSATEEERREEASLAGTHIQRTVELLTRQSDEAIIRPMQVEDNCCWRLNPDEIARFVTTIDLQLGLAA